MKVAPDDTIVILESQGFDDEQIDSILQMRNLRRPPSYGASLLRNTVGQGVAMGFGDEIEAGVKTGFGFAGDYTQARDQIRSDQNQWQEENPVASFASEAVGGLATGLAGAARMGGMKLLGTMGVGALEGSISGLGHSNEIETAPGDMVKGSLLGGITGGLMHGLQRLAGGLPSNRADQRVRLALEDAGIDTPAKAQRALDEIGDSGVIADISESTQAALRPAVLNPGPGREQAKGFLADRLKNQPDEVTTLTDSVMGRQTQHSSGYTSGETPLSRIDMLENYRSTVAKQNYDLAMSHGMPAPAPEIIATITTKDGKRAFKEAVDRYNSRNLMNQVDWTTLDAPRITDLRFWDGYQKRLSGLEGKSIRSGDNDAASYLGNMRRTVTDSLDANNPDYKVARRNFATTSGAIDAIKKGQTVFKKGNPDDVIREVNAMSTLEQQEFLFGALDEVKRMVGGKSDKANAVLKLIGYSDTKKKLRAAFGDDNNADALFDEFYTRLKQLAKQGETSTSIMAGSRTAEVEAEQHAVNAIKGIAQLAQGDLARGGLTTGRGIMNALTGHGKQADAEFVQRMLQQNPEAAAVLERVFMQGNVPPQLTGAIQGGAINAGVGTMTTPSPIPDPEGDVLKASGMKQ